MFQMCKTKNNNFLFWHIILIAYRNFGTIIFCSFFVVYIFLSSLYFYYNFIILHVYSTCNHFCRFTYCQYQEILHFCFKNARYKLQRNIFPLFLNSNLVFVIFNLLSIVYPISLLFRHLLKINILKIRHKIFLCIKVLAIIIAQIE